MADQPENPVYTLSSSSQKLIDDAQKLSFAVALIEQLRGGTAHRAPLPRLTEMLDALLRGVPYLGYPIPPPFQVFRGRIDNKHRIFETANEFSYKPVHLVREFGRCHRPGTAVFYGASNLDTVLSELTPEVGDVLHIGVAKVRVGQHLRLNAVSEIDYVRRYDRALIGNHEAYALIKEFLDGANSEAAIRAILVDAFFADIFSQPAHKQRDYKATSVLSGLILDARSEAGELLVDGFAYPSVGHRGGLNFAIRPDRFDASMEWVHFMAFEVTDYLGFGLYGRRQYAKASKVDDQGKVLWEIAPVIKT